MPVIRESVRLLAVRKVRSICTMHSCRGFGGGSRGQPGGSANQHCVGLIKGGRVAFAAIREPSRMNPS